MPANTITTKTKKLRRNLRKLLDRALDRVEVQAETALAYARKLVAQIGPRPRRAAQCAERMRHAVQGGLSFGGNDLILRAGQLRDVAGDPALLPLYATLTYDRRW